MASKPPSGQQPPNTISAITTSSRRFLLYGIGLSILLHFLLGPLVGFKKLEQQDKEVEKVSVSKKITKVQTPKPTPTPVATPTPKPILQTPPPHTTPPPNPVRLKVDVPKTDANSQNGPTETQYNVKQGSQEGVPQGQNTGVPASVAPAATPAPTPPPTPTPRACANPNLDATATEKVSPEMPEIARQMGASGTAQVKVTLDDKGKVLSVAIQRSTNNRALDAAAMDAAKQSKYRSEIRNCVPTGGSYLYTVVFENQ